MTEPYRAFWLDPDWSGGDNLRDPGTRPFWELPPKRADDPLRGVLREGAVYQRVPGRYIEHGVVEPEHTCGPFVTLWTGYRFCEICEKPAE